MSQLSRDVNETKHHETEAETETLPQVRRAGTSKSCARSNSSMKT